jgi:hypothetical protein
MTEETSLTQSVEGLVKSQVVVLRGQRVLLAQQLAVLYGIETKVLNQAVARNRARFPVDFMFQLTWQEVDLLESQGAILNVENGAASRSQNVTLKRGRNVKYLPYAFTEQGVAMLSSVLRSPRAVAVNIEIMRTFVRLRGMLAEHEQLKEQLAALEKRYDKNFRVVFEAINELMQKPDSSPYSENRIGFTRKTKP